MSSVTGLPRSRICARALAVALIGAGAAGCSAEPERFDDSGYSQTTGSVTPGHRYASASFRPPLPIPDAPLAAAAPARLERAAATTARSSVRPVALGKPSIKMSRREVGPLAVGTKTVSIARQARPRNDEVVLATPNGTRVPGRIAPMLGEQPPARPAEGPAAVVPAPDPAPAGGSPQAAEAAPTFHWPVRGQVIAGFGSKINGQQNHGINVAVPEDTAIKAADDGVVVYSGNQLKSYGNLLLVRHPNGYVTVYAHAKQLLVKGGDEIKRGQVIAKSGQTGDVTTPQIHFEIRKASAPVDPMPYLGGA